MLKRVQHDRQCLQLRHSELDSELNSEKKLQMPAKGVFIFPLFLLYLLGTYFGEWLTGYKTCQR